MAKTTKKPAAKKAAPKAAKAAPKKAAPAAAKPLKEVLGKSALVKHLAETSSVAAKDVKAVLAAIEDAVSGTAPASPELGEVAVDEFAPGQGDRR